MGPNSDESFNRETLEGFQTFVDLTDPASHFTRTVYVMRLHIHCKPCLMEERGREGKEEKEGGWRGERERMNTNKWLHSSAYQHLSQNRSRQGEREEGRKKDG